MVGDNEKSQAKDEKNVNTGTMDSKESECNEASGSQCLSVFEVNSVIERFKSELKIEGGQEESIERKTGYKTPTFERKNIHLPAAPPRSSFLPTLQVPPEKKYDSALPVVVPCVSVLTPAPFSSESGRKQKLANIPTSELVKKNEYFLRGVSLWKKGLKQEARTLNTSVPTTSASSEARNATPTEIDPSNSSSKPVSSPKRKKKFFKNKFRIVHLDQETRSSPGCSSQPDYFFLLNYPDGGSMFADSDDRDVNKKKQLKTSDFDSSVPGTLSSSQSDDVANYAQEKNLPRNLKTQISCCSRKKRRGSHTYIPISAFDSAVLGYSSQSDVPDVTKKHVAEGISKLTVSNPLNIYAKRRKLESSSMPKTSSEPDKVDVARNDALLLHPVLRNSPQASSDSAVNKGKEKASKNLAEISEAMKENREIAAKSLSDPLLHAERFSMHQYNMRMNKKMTEQKKSLDELVQIRAARRKKISELSVDFRPWWQSLRQIQKSLPKSIFSEREDDSIEGDFYSICNDSLELLEKFPQFDEPERINETIVYKDTEVAGESMSKEEFLKLRNNKFEESYKWSCMEFERFSFYLERGLLSTQNRIKSLLVPINKDVAFYEYQKFLSFVESLEPTRKNLAVLLFHVLVMIIYHFFKSGRIFDGQQCLDFSEKMFSHSDGDEHKSYAVILKILSKFHEIDNKFVLKSLFKEMPVSSMGGHRSAPDHLPYDISEQQEFLRLLSQKRYFLLSHDSMEALVSFLTQLENSSVLMQLLRTFFNFGVEAPVESTPKGESLSLSLEEELEEEELEDRDHISPIKKKPWNDFSLYKTTLKNVDLRFELCMLEPLEESNKNECLSSERISDEKRAETQLLLDFSAPTKNTKPRFLNSQLIVQALSSVESMKMTPREICSYIAGRYSYFKKSDYGWQKSIHKELRYSKFFKELPRDEIGAEPSYRIRSKCRDKLIEEASKEPYRRFNISAVDVTSDRNFIACSFDDAKIFLYTRKKDALFGKYDSDNSSSVAFSTADENENIAADYKNHYVLQGHHCCVYSLRFSVRKNTSELLLFSAGLDNVRLWDVERAGICIEIYTHSSAYLDIDVSSDSEFFVTASGELRRGPLFQWKEEPPGELKKGPLVQCKEEPSGGAVELWSVHDKSPIGIFKHSSAFYLCRFHPNNMYIAAASSDKTILLLKTVDGNPVRLFLGHDVRITALVFTPNGQFLISADQVGRVCIWSIIKGTILLTLHDHTDCVVSVCCDSTGMFLSTIASDHCIITYDFKKLIRKYEERKKRCSNLRVESAEVMSHVLNTCPYFVKYCSSRLVVVATRV